MDPSRRAFLGGRRPPDPPGPDAPPVALAPTCLALRGVECRICGDACDTGAIRFRPQRGGVARPLLDLAACTACGDCVPPCPVGALSVSPPARGG